MLWCGMLHNIITMLHCILLVTIYYSMACHVTVRHAARLCCCYIWRSTPRVAPQTGQQIETRACRRVNKNRDDGKMPVRRRRAHQRAAGERARKARERGEYLVPVSSVNSKHRQQENNQTVGTAPKIVIQTGVLPPQGMFRWK